MFPAKTTLSHIEQLRFEDAAANIKEYEKPYLAEFFSAGGWKTILASPYRTLVMALSDVRIRAGFDLMIRSFHDMTEAAQKNGAKFIVVLLPTKEFVFQDKAAGRFLDEKYRKLLVVETQLKSKLVDALHRDGIVVIDPLPALEQAQSQPYFEDSNGHPNQIGHEIIAGSIYQYLKHNNLD